MKPDIYFFNPTCEIAIANGTVSYMPNRLLRQFEKELGTIPLFFGNHDDIVLVRELPDPGFINLLSSYGVSVPHFKLLEEALRDESFINSPKKTLRPWGWSPVAHHLLAPLKESCSQIFHSLPNSNWHDNHKNIYSRATALNLLNDIKDLDHQNRYISGDLIPRTCSNINEIESAIAQWGQIVLKAPWSSSGRGLQILRSGELNSSITQWIMGTLKNQGYVMVEPWLNKIYDFSLHYKIDHNSNIEYLGPSYFFTNTNGQYQGSILSGKAQNHDDKLASILTPTTLQLLSLDIQKALKKSTIPSNYCGYLGIDCMIFLDSQNQMVIHPCLEINIRYTMGTLALFLERHLHPNAHGSFKIFFEPGKNFTKLHNDMNILHPFKMEQGLWRKGYLPMVCPYTPKKCGAYILLE